MVGKLFRLLKDTAFQYPAVLSGYMIYMYYFFVTLDFYKSFKVEHLSSSEFLTHFDAVLWMWLLSYALVKILSYREEMHVHEKLLLIRDQQAKEAEWRCDQYATYTKQLKTMVNEPIVKAFRSVGLIRQKEGLGQVLDSKLKQVDEQLHEVFGALGRFYSNTNTITSLKYPSSECGK
ncbi:MAG: hypothetical protein ACE5H0_04335 [Bacteroidota bacterium]